MTEYVTGMAPVASRYDAYILDLWGVIHDGTALYPGVRDVLERLRALDKRVMFLSNAPRRSHKVEVVLRHLGITPDLYDAILSSGEAGFQWLAGAKMPPLGTRYFYIGPDKDLDVLDGLNYARVMDIKAAEFVLNVGFGSEEMEDDDHEDELIAAQQSGLPMLCLNPDLEVVKISGERFACAGVLAHRYAQMGGKVVWFGKPHAAVYAECEKILQPVSRERILAVGDSLETDIPGAQNYGIDNMLVRGGILKEKTVPELTRMYEGLNLKPHYVAPSFCW